MPSKSPSMNSCYYESELHKAHPSDLVASSMDVMPISAQHQDTLPKEHFVNRKPNVQVPLLQKKFNRRASGTAPRDLAHSLPPTEHAYSDLSNVPLNERLPQPVMPPPNLPQLDGTSVQPFQAVPPPPAPSASFDQPQQGASAPPTSTSPGAQSPPLLDSDPAANQPTPLPAAHHTFSLSNSSQVVSISRPSLASYTLSPDSESHPPNFEPNSKRHDGTTKPSTPLPLPYYIAMVLPALFLLSLATFIGYRCMHRKKRGRKLAMPSHEDGYDRNDIPTESFGALQGFASMIEKGRHSIISNGSCVKGGADLQMQSFAVDKPQPYPALPPLPGSSPLLSSPFKVAFTSSIPPAHEETDSLPDLKANEGTPCKTSCIVTRTFTTSLPDELAIGIGDQVVVYLLFDDGWCLGENLDIEKHQTTNGGKYPRMGVLPQDCLSGLDLKRTEDLNLSSPNKVVSTEATEARESQLVTGQGGLEASSETALPSSAKQSFLSPCVRPQRASSLQVDREANLYRELERALALQP